MRWRQTMMLAALVLAGVVRAENGEDCTTFCNPQFGPGIGVTCQAALADTGHCRQCCFYENGWWICDGQVVRRPDGSARDQRPLLTDVPPYGYPTLYGYQANTWEPCPGSYFGPMPAPPHVWEWCQAVARAEYHDGEAWCSQAME